jgi:transcriptional regulator with XRE-family HTH domain
MNNFGEVLRDLRVAQDLGLRETAVKVGISPAYLSRIERNKEKPPSAEVIKCLAKVLAADPDVLFRLAASTDPELSDYLNRQPEMMRLIRCVMEAGLSDTDLQDVTQYVERIVRTKT